MTALRLGTRLASLAAAEGLRVTSVALTDGTRTARDDPRGSGRYALHRGTALTIVVGTGGAAWKTANHADAAKRHEHTEPKQPAKQTKHTIRYSTP